jgi:hypothetical protein
MHLEARAGGEGGPAPGFAAFRLSRQLTLILSCLCLGYSQLLLLPGISVFVVLVLLGLVLAFVLEGRWSLPVWLVNLLGLAIAGGWGLWVVSRLQAATDAFLSVLPLPAALVPYVGPLLLLLLLVESFRQRALKAGRPDAPKAGGPDGAGDFWRLQGLGLLQVSLACVLAQDTTLALLVLAYLVCGLWCLTLFHLQIEDRGSRIEDRGSRKKGLLSLSILDPRSSILASLALLLLAVLPAVLLYLMLPRVPEGTWQPLSAFSKGTAPPLQTGFSEQIDLNRTGPVEVNEEVALTVTASDSGGEPKLDLPDEQRWRGAGLDSYQGGLWKSGYVLPPGSEAPQAGGSVITLALPLGNPRRSRPRQGREEHLLDLGPRQYYLNFQFQPRKAGGLFLADPATLGPAPGTTGDVGVPVLSLRPGPVLFYQFQGGLVPNVYAYHGECHYRQVAAPVPDPDLVPAEALQEGYLLYLSFPPRLPRLREWADHLLEEVLARPGYHLTAADLDWQPFPGFFTQAEMPMTPRVVPPPTASGRFLKPRCWEKVAGALTEYLARSGEYTYSLDLRRSDLDLDPTVDFLCNVKEGHCERYAGGLALLLRSLGVPCRVAKGFRGQENQGDGTYLVRQSHAHSWVEVLVVRSPPGPAAGGEDVEKTWPRYWRTLDPTPSSEGAAAPPFSLDRFWENCLKNGWAFWHDLILEYNPDKQQGMAEDLWQDLVSKQGTAVRWLRRSAVAAGLLLAAWLGLFVARRRRARRRAAARAGPAVPFYARLLTLLERYCRLRPRPAQTPQEFAAAARQHLAGAGCALADVPVRLAGLFYRVRYGDGPLTEAERREAEEQLDRFEALLREPGPAGAKVENGPLPA